MGARNSRRSILRGGVVGAAGLAMLVATPSALQTAVANGDTRTLSFVHTHTGERATITFKRDGRYDADGMRRMNHFLRDWRRNEQIEMDPRLVDLVWEVYRDVRGAEPIHLVSAYRSPTTNNMLRARSSGVARGSQHTRGKAMDFFIPGVSTQLIREKGVLRQRGGVGFYSGSNGFVHIDVGSVRAWPRMTREQLARLFPDGNTIHLPSNGPPLPGYQATLARLGRDGRGGEGASFLAFARQGRDVEAEEGPTRASAAGSGRGILATLFGRGADDEEAPTRAPRQPAPAAAERPASVVARADPRPDPRQQELRAAPLPPARPLDLAAAEPDEEEEPATPVAAVPLPPPHPEREARETDIVTASTEPAPRAGMQLASLASQPVASPRRAPAPLAPAARRVDLIAPDLTRAALRPLMDALPMRQVSVPLPTRIEATALSFAEAPDALGFGLWRTRRTDGFSGPLVRVRPTAL
jgi:uncharacterized protein YcbK (DUF882 family)